MKIEKHLFKKLIFLILDIVALNCIFLFSLWARFNFGMLPLMYQENIYFYFAVITGVNISLFIIGGLYRSLWTHAGTHELMKIIFYVSLGSVLSYTIAALNKHNIPLTVTFVQCFFTMGYLGVTRVGYRVFRRFHLCRKGYKITQCKNVMIIGAGEAGMTVIKEMKIHPELAMKPVVCIDDDYNKHNKLINDVKIAGGRDKIKSSVNKYDVDEIVIAIPSATHNERNSIWEICKKTACKIKIVPGVYQLVDGSISMSQIRDVEIEDLLGRDPIKTDLNEICHYVVNKTILVTGGAGSIGSELCRQILKYQPKKLIVLDIYENTAYELEHELKRTYPEANIDVVICSVRDLHALKKLFPKYAIDIVFHAAAHKHVPLMEGCPNQAIKNNVFGTYNVAKMADQFHVQRFILISTDKAVNPTNIMGATKRIAEMLIQGMNKQSRTEFVAVRFGNVLGSNGSVIPLFKKQIENGGPVTITHPEITRYFMLIPEAVQLVIQAGAMAKGGEIFVLDMGKPVKIIDLAKKLIELSGLKLGQDINIEYVGLRPGEKLYEELLLDEEGLKETGHNKIFIGSPIEMSFDEFKKALDVLWTNRNNETYIYDWINQWVEGYHQEGHTEIVCDKENSINNIDEEEEIGIVVMV